MCQPISSTVMVGDEAINGQSALELLAKDLESG